MVPKMFKPLKFDCIFFQEAFGLYMTFLQDIDEMDDYTRHAWQKVLDVVTARITADMEKLDKEKVFGVD